MTIIERLLVEQYLRLGNSLDSAGQPVWVITRNGFTVERDITEASHELGVFYIMTPLQDKNGDRVIRPAIKFGGGFRYVVNGTMHSSGIKTVQVLAESDHKIETIAPSSVRDDVIYHTDDFSRFVTKIKGDDTELQPSSAVNGFLYYLMTPGNHTLYRHYTVIGDML